MTDIPIQDDCWYDYMNYLWFIDGHKTMNKFGRMSDALIEIATYYPTIDKTRSYVIGASGSNADQYDLKWNIDQFIEYCSRWHNFGNLVRKYNPYYNPDNAI